MNVVKNGDGDEAQESEDQGISFSFNSFATPETVDAAMAPTRGSRNRSDSMD